MLKVYDFRHLLLLEVIMKANFEKIHPFIIPIIVTLIVVLLFHYIFMLGYVPSASMEPTLDAGSLILGLRIHGELKPQDIIIFRRDGMYMIKRIAATEGQKIVYNGQAEAVPEDCFYVLGDSELDSHDSRYWEDPYVKLEDVMAKLLLPVTRK